MRIWITSDWHLNHEEITKFEARKNGYESILLRKLRNNIKPDDLMINLGDVIMRNASTLKQFLDQIPCKKVLVRGNHDKRTIEWYMNKGFDFVCDEFKFSHLGKKIIFSHIPLEDVPDGWLNIHGHLHSGIHRTFSSSPKHILYNPEASGYNLMPVLLQHILMQK